MSNIAKNTLKYILLSDLHLGESDSVFTPVSSQGKPGAEDTSDPPGESYELVEAFSDCLADLLFNINKEELPSFLLNGDILGLSFSTYPQSLTAFEHFIKSFTRRNKICDTVAYIPGNHDHHIWNLAMEENYKNILSATESGDRIPDMPHTSSPDYDRGFYSSFFDSFLGLGEESPTEIKILYPNLIIPPTTKGDPHLLIHHGHFAEDTYYFVTQAMQALYPSLPKPQNLEELENENNAWIDFSFSQLGRSGLAGEYFEKLMLTLSSKTLLEKERDELATHLSNAVDYPFLPFDWMEKLLSKTLINKIANRIRSERYKEGTVCSQKTMDGLLLYINYYCSEILSEAGWREEPVHILWGHTHKPFERLIPHQKINDLRTTNSGGWVIPFEAKPTHGASILLINQRNEVRALRIFNDSAEGGTMHFKIMYAEGEEKTPFGEEIMECLYDKGGHLRPVWENFKNLLVEEISRRRNNKNLNPNEARH